MTIVVSSHILSELEDYSTQMLMIREGRVAGGGVVAAGGGVRDGARIAVTFGDPPEDLAGKLSALGLVVERQDGDEALLVAPEGEEDDAVLAKLIGAGLKVRAFRAARKTLEDAYLAEVRR